VHGDELQLQDFHHEGSHAEEEVQLGLHQDMLTWMRQTLMHVKHHTTLIRQNIETCMAGQVNGHHFKRSVDKGLESAAFIPTNLHTQHTFFTHAEKAMFANTTVGAFSAHVYGFSKGVGVSQLREEAKKLWHHISNDSGKRKSNGRMEGFMKKKGENFYDLWKSRYFVLDAERSLFSWYKEAPQSEREEPQGHIHLSSVVPPEVTIEGENYVHIHTVGRIYRLYHADSREVLEWSRRLRFAMKCATPQGRQRQMSRLLRAPSMVQ